MTMTVARFVAEEAVHRELPMPPWLFAAIALLGFAFLLGVTWSFRGTAQKHASPRGQQKAGHAPAADASHGHDYQAGHPEPEGDDPHWPEHPGHH